MRLIRIFSSNVRRNRQMLRITQEQLAALSGLHVTYINAIERGRRNISLDNVERIATAMNIEPYKLFIEKAIDAEWQEEEGCNGRTEKK